MDACYFSSDHVRAGERTVGPYSQVSSLLHQLTVDADRLLYDYIKKLGHFPDMDCFEHTWKFHQDRCLGQTPADEFIKFVKRTLSLPQQLCLRSLQNLHKKLQSREILCLRNGMDMQSSECKGWLCNPGIAFALWRLVELCFNDDANDIRDLVGDYIARVDIGDPCVVTFCLPDDCDNGSSWSEGSDGDTVVSINPDVGVCEELVTAIIKFLVQYLLYDSVLIVEMASKCLQGLLSTDKGRKALQSLDANERSYVGVLIKGVDVKLAEDLLTEDQSKSTDNIIPLEDAPLWQTQGKTFEEWICQLVYSLIHHTYYK